MDEQDLNEVLERKEDKNVEWKGKFPEQVRKLRKEMIAFANTEGGIIFIGIEDDGTVIGVDNPVKTGERLTGIAKECSPPIRLEISRITKNSKTIIAAKVPHKPLCLYNGTAFIRDDSSSRPAESNEVVEIVLNISKSEKYSIDSTKLKNESNNKKIISQKKLRKKAFKGYFLSLTYFVLASIVVASIFFFNLPVYIILLNMIAATAITALYAFKMKFYYDEMFLYKTIFFNIKHLKSESSVFTGDGRFIQTHDKKRFLIYKPSAKCIYPHCNGEIIVVNAPHKEVLKTRKGYVGICSVAKEDHSYHIDYNGIAKKKDIDWSPSDKK